MTKRILITVLCLFALTAALSAQDMDETAEVFNEGGLVYTASAYNVAETTQRLTDLLEGNENITLMGVINHTANAENVDLDLPPTRELFFGNPALGTPLMQAAQSVAIDLPQKMLVWEAEDGTVYVGYNSPYYIAARHGIPADTEPLATINGALSNIAASVTENPEATAAALSEVSMMDDVDNMAAMDEPRLTTVESENDFETTVTNLQAALDANGFIVPFVVAHSANAENADLELNPTTLVIFGNPQVGTPFMQLERKIAIDLPQKMLVWADDDGQVYVTYNDPRYLFERHGVEDMPDNVENVAGALQNLAELAATAAE